MYRPFKAPASKSNDIVKNFTHIKKDYHGLINPLYSTGNKKVEKRQTQQWFPMVYPNFAGFSFFVSLIIENGHFVRKCAYKNKIVDYV